ncbi:helix-turn-helix domain-containing protein [Chengkuizengella marina]|uniref:XRE family transcriptional regulator n=1 Tax=Chengkuizengella marina TaxID=2507566 RepID=A0A6N9Q8A9_9BACL|nr:helix-turn-helix transcriptional regulator [Chengkuizengella marina]NBI30931.1 XRE family transcriptional regulator [Chengkuizengella marina]
MSIGINVKQIRKSKGFTQVELADRANLSRSYLADVERDRYNPSVETLNSIAKALGVSSSFLLGATKDELECRKLYDEIRINVDKITYGYYPNKKFTDQTINTIHEESTEIRKKYNVEFEYTPDGVMGICEDMFDQKFLQDFVRMVERVRENVEKNESLNIYNEKRDFKKMLEDDTEMSFDGKPLSKVEKEKILRLMEVMLDDKK